MCKNKTETWLFWQNGKILFQKMKQFEIKIKAHV
jgi:hypothetical protein